MYLLLTFLLLMYVHEVLKYNNMKKKKSTKDKRSKTQNRLLRSHYYWNDYPRVKVLIYTCIYYLNTFALLWLAQCM